MPLREASSLNDPHLPSNYLRELRESYEKERKPKKAKSEALRRKFSKKSDKHTGSSPAQRKRNAGYHDPYEMAAQEPERNWK